MAYEYIERFKKLGFGMFVHFGLYSVVGKGEWYLKNYPDADVKKYEALTGKFKIKKSWARDLVKTAKSAGCKYITLTTRHHDGFSLYDTCGLNDYDAPHSAAGRDLVREFVDACREGGLVPFFYHTLLDWHNPDYERDFPAYIDYLIRSVELLCKNYGKIGGLWFDGMWDKFDADWQEDRLYGTIRKYQPEAMIINNTGLERRGQAGHPEIDSVTFERGRPVLVENPIKPIAGEMCEVLNDHWGYAKDDVNYKSVSNILESLITCRHCGCNFLLNLGPMGNGSVRALDKEFFAAVGKWQKINRFFLDGAVATDEIRAEGVRFFKKDGEYYGVISGVPMMQCTNEFLSGTASEIRIAGGIRIKRAVWLDNKKPLTLADGGSRIITDPFYYGTSLYARVFTFKLK